MSLTLGLTQSQIQIAFRAFLLSILPAGIEVIAGQANRVAEPQGADFVVFTPILRNRISTNSDEYADCAFTASISGTVMTVTAIRLGMIGIGNTLFGTNVATGTTITAQTSGPSGGVGTYTVSQSQAVSSETMACGVETITQATKITFQVDVHGPNSADNAEVISTLFRDEYATSFFSDNGYAGISPLYTDDLKQVPFINAEQQYENRWIIEAVLQADQTITVSQQFADRTSLALEIADL